MVKIENLSKSFGDLHVLSKVNLTVNTGEVLSIIGPSGTESSAPRTTSFIYAAEFSVKPMMHTAKGEMSRKDGTMDGMPKYNRNSCGISGVPRKKDTYTPQILSSTGTLL